MAAVENTIRVRLKAFTVWHNTNSSLGLVESHISKSPPPNWPVALGAVSEVESEDRTDRKHYTQYLTSAYRTFLVKLAVHWGNTLPQTRMEGIEDKLNTLSGEVEESTYLMNGINSHGLYETGDGQEVFTSVNIESVDKIYDGPYAIGGTITMRWKIEGTWPKDTTFA